MAGALMQEGVGRKHKHTKHKHKHKHKHKLGDGAARLRAVRNEALRKTISARSTEYGVQIWLANPPPEWPGHNTGHAEAESGLATLERRCVRSHCS
jgi:hypothetical protein